MWCESLLTHFKNSIKKALPLGIRERHRDIARFISRSGKDTHRLNYGWSIDEKRTHEDLPVWNRGLRLAAITCGSILAANIIFTIWAANISRSGLSLGAIRTGDYEEMDRVNGFFHIAINILNTLLLASSSFTMQLVSAPTRDEVDVAHRAGKHFIIGLLDLRNLHTWKKKIIIVMLSLSGWSISFLYILSYFLLVAEKNYQKSFRTRYIH